MKRVIGVFLVLIISGVFASAAIMHDADQFWVNVNGADMKLQDAISHYELNRGQTYVSTNNLANYIHDIDEIWFETTIPGYQNLLDALQTKDFNAPTTGELSTIFSPHHDANEINIIIPGTGATSTLQDAINNGQIGCVADLGLICNVNDCTTGTVQCDDSCGGNVIYKPINTPCGGTNICNGAGVCSVCVKNKGASCGGTECKNAGTVQCDGSCSGVTNKASWTLCGRGIISCSVSDNSYCPTGTNTVGYQKWCNVDKCNSNGECIYTSGAFYGLTNTKTCECGCSSSQRECKSCDSGSCPFVYSYDGKEWNFEHEAFTFSVAKPAEERTYDRLKYLKEVDGSYYLKIQEELTEVSYIDDFKFYLVDHEKEGFVMPSLDGSVHIIQNLEEPISCFDKRDNTCLTEVSFIDDLSYKDDFYSIDIDDKSTYEDWIVLDFEKPKDTKFVKLFLNVKKQQIVTDIWEFYIKNIGENYWDYWQNLLKGNLLSNLFRNMLNNVIDLRIEVWNGGEWVPYGYIKPGLDTLDDFLITVDISEIDSENLKVRLISGKGFYEFFYVAVDYSDDGEMRVSLIEPEYAIFNGEIDVGLKLDVEDDSYLSLMRGDYVNLKYDLPTKHEDWQRDPYISIKGYYNYIGFGNQSFSGFIEGSRLWLNSLYSQDDILRNFILGTRSNTLY